jgi:hypothetical protein
MVRRFEAEPELSAFLSETSSIAPVSWPPEASGGPGPTSLPATFTDNLRLEAYNVRDRTLLSGETAEVSTYWRLTEPVPYDLRLFAHLQSGPGQVVAWSEDWGADLNSIQTNDIIVQYNLLQPTGDTLPEEGQYALAIGLYVPGTEHRLRVLYRNTPYSDRLILQNVNVLK